MWWLRLLGAPEDGRVRLVADAHIAFAAKLGSSRADGGLEESTSVSESTHASRIEISRYSPGISSRSEAAALLAESIGNPTARKLEELIESCTQDDYPALWIASSSDRTIGVLRLDARGPSTCTITHIAVLLELRGQGIGRKLIEIIRDDLNFKCAEAETDDDAVSFYKSCGFKIEPLGVNRYGIQRYKCVTRF